MTTTRSETPWTPALTLGLAAALALWLGSVYLLGTAEVFATEGPRALRPVLLSIAVPVGIFLAAFAGSARLRRRVLSWDLATLTMLQHWRVVGFAFLPLLAHGVLPGLFAWPAGLGDVAVGLAAPLMVARLRRDPGFARSRRFLAYHALGMLDFVVAAGTASLAAGAYPGLIAGGPTSAAMEVWPLLVFPAFIVPIFIVLHLAVFFQVWALRRAGAGEIAGAVQAV